MYRHFYLPSFKETPYVIFPESVGWYDSEPHHHVDRAEGAWPSYSIHVIVKGRGYLEYEGKRYALTRGNAFIYFPYQKQKYYSAQDDPWEIRWVHFYGAHLKNYLYEQGIRQPLWSHQRIAEWAETFHQLLVEMEEHNILRMSRLSTLTYALLAEFIQHATPLSMNRGSNTNDRIIELMPSMQKKACEPFSLEEWAAQAQVSVHYFCKIFRKTTSMSPMDFITLCRIQMAKQWLIEKPSWPIKTVASEAGYPSTSYFNMRFLEQEGVTPSAYRRSHQYQSAEEQSNT